MRLHAGLADVPERQLLLRALQKRRLKEYEGLADHAMNEIFLTGALAMSSGDRCVPDLDSDTTLPPPWP